MPNLSQLADSLVEALTSAGLSATTDIRTLNAPAVLVSPPRLTARHRGWSAEFDLVAVVGNVGQVESLRLLGPLVDQVQAALAGACTAAEPVDVTAGNATYPGYKLTLTVTAC